MSHRRRPNILAATPVVKEPKKKIRLTIEVEYDYTTRRSDIHTYVTEGLDNLRQYGVIAQAKLIWPPQEPEVEDVTHLS